VPAGQPDEHAKARAEPPTGEHTGVPPVQAVVQAPQRVAMSMAESQPSSRLPEQLRKPASQDSGGYVQAPAVQVTAPVTLVNSVQS
jgi:hypothetical protein